MPGRYSSSDYRFGFGRQEKDDEIYGSGNSYTAEYWQYDPRLGRRWNTDQVVKPWESGYACFNNNPIFYSDPSGLDGEGPNGECAGDVKTNEDGTKEKYTADGKWEKAYDVKNMKTSPEGKEFIKAYDPLGTKEANQKDAKGKVEITCPFNDCSNNATIGYGHLLHRGPVEGDEGTFDDGITPAQANTILDKDIKERGEGPVKRNIKVPLTQKEFDALVIATYNGASGKTMFKVVNSGDLDQKTVEKTFMAYTFAKNAKTKKFEQPPGLITRARQTANVFLFGNYNSKH